MLTQGIDDFQTTDELYCNQQGDLPVEVTFAVSDEEAQKLLDLVRAEKLSLFYVKLPIEFGTIDGGDGDETQP